MDAEMSMSDLVGHEAEQPFDQLMVLLFHKNFPCCSNFFLTWLFLDFRSSWIHQRC